MDFPYTKGEALVYGNIFPHLCQVTILDRLHEAIDNSGLKFHCEHSSIGVTGHPPRAQLTLTCSYALQD